METDLVNPNREAAIWARVMDSPSEVLTRAAAEYLLSFRFSSDDERRMLELAERSNSGALTAEELAELDSYLHVGNVLAVMQARAKALIRLPGA
jgi:hypothetical protein